MTFNEKKSLIISFVLIQVSFFTYVNFLAYKPKVLRQLSEVKGVQTIETDTLPYPEGYNKISYDTTSKSRVTTVEISKSTKDVQNFYKNVLLSKGWEVESESDLVVKYKKEGKFITITTASLSNSGTIFSIEATK